MIIVTEAALTRLQQSVVKLLQSNNIFDKIAIDGKTTASNQITK